MQYQRNVIETTRKDKELRFSNFIRQFQIKYRKNDDFGVPSFVF